jgi:hypothetical protein
VAQVDGGLETLAPFLPAPPTRDVFRDQPSCHAYAALEIWFQKKSVHYAQATTSAFAIDIAMSETCRRLWTVSKQVDTANYFFGESSTLPIPKPARASRAIGKR